MVSFTLEVLEDEKGKIPEGELEELDDSGSTPNKEPPKVVSRSAELDGEAGIIENWDRHVHSDGGDPSTSQPPRNFSH